MNANKTFSGNCFSKASPLQVALAALLEGGEECVLGTKSFIPLPTLHSLVFFRPPRPVEFLSRYIENN